MDNRVAATALEQPERWESRQDRALVLPVVLICRRRDEQLLAAFLDDLIYSGTQPQLAAIFDDEPEAIATVLEHGGPPTLVVFCRPPSLPREHLIERIAVFSRFRRGAHRLLVVELHPDRDQEFRALVMAGVHTLRRQWAASRDNPNSRPRTRAAGEVSAPSTVEDCRAVGPGRIVAPRVAVPIRPIRLSPSVSSSQATIATTGERKSAARKFPWRIVVAALMFTAFFGAIMVVRAFLDVDRRREPDPAATRSRRMADHTAHVPQSTNKFRSPGCEPRVHPSRCKTTRFHLHRSTLVP